MLDYNRIGVSDDLNKKHSSKNVIFVVIDIFTQKI